MSWRTEADDDWLAGHRSTVLAWLRRCLPFLRPVGDAFSFADTGPYAGAPRDPELDPQRGAKAYSTVRHATSPTTTARTWVAESRMPSVRRARATARRNVV
jgi:hypothetical protein